MDPDRVGPPTEITTLTVGASATAAQRVGSGRFRFRAAGGPIYVLFGPSAAMNAPSAVTGWLIDPTDGNVDLDLAEPDLFIRAISDGASRTLKWYTR